LSALRLETKATDWSGLLPCDYLNSASAGPKDALVLDDMIMPTMIPKSPRAEPKISMIRILTNMRGSCASDRAQAEPTTPTQILQTANTQAGI